MWDQFIPFTLPRLSRQPSPQDTGEEQGTDPCLRCGHVLAWHVMVATGETELDGGTLVCPACPCALAWAPAGQMLPQLPPAHILAYLRCLLFGVQ